jgi:hypothetical protein
MPGLDDAAPGLACAGMPGMVSRPSPAETAGTDDDDVRGVSPAGAEAAVVAGRDGLAGAASGIPVDDGAPTLLRCAGMPAMVGASTLVTPGSVTVAGAVPAPLSAGPACACCPSGGTCTMITLPQVQR